jgi:hypothetical protein
MGFSVRINTPVHFNLSGACLHTVFDTIRNYQVFTIQNDADGEGGKVSIVLIYLQVFKLFLGKVSKKGFLRDHRSDSVGSHDINGSRHRTATVYESNSGQMIDQTQPIVRHYKSLTLQAHDRTGFSLLNLTGQAVRYLQQWEGGRQTVEYLNNGERGPLNFVPSQTLIRNNHIVEEIFDVQQGRSASARAKMKRKLVGNRVAVQICGFHWLKSIEADELKLQYKSLKPILGRADPSRKYRDEKVKNVLKLLVEIVPFNGGRMMILRSVFSIRNECNHTVKIKTTSQPPEECENVVESAFELRSKETLYLPLSLLNKSILVSRGTSLGLLFLQPYDSSAVKDELIARLGIAPGTINESTDPINLLHLAYRTNSDGDVENQKFSVDYYHLPCHINPEERSRNSRRNNLRKSTEVEQFWSGDQNSAILR